MVDQDEFEAHQIQLGYPLAEIEHAERVANQVLESVRRGDAPFDGVAAAEWFAIVKSLPEGPP